MVEEHGRKWPFVWQLGAWRLALLFMYRTHWRLPYFLPRVKCDRTWGREGIKRNLVLIFFGVELSRKLSDQRFR